MLADAAMLLRRHALLHASASPQPHLPRSLAPQQSSLDRKTAHHDIFPAAPVQFPAQRRQSSRLGGRHSWGPASRCGPAFSCSMRPPLRNLGIEMRVRFPAPAPLRCKDLRRSASEVQVSLAHLMRWNNPTTQCNKLMHCGSGCVANCPRRALPFALALCSLPFSIGLWMRCGADELTFRVDRAQTPLQNHKACHRISGGQVGFLGTAPGNDCLLNRPCLPLQVCRRSVTPSCLSKKGVVA